MHVMLSLALSSVGSSHSGEAGNTPEPPPVASALAEEAASVARPLLHWGDYDRDGKLDVFALYANGEGRLFRNAGDGAFADVSAAVELPPVHGTLAVHWIDYDGDGALDLYLSAGRAMERLFRNTGRGTFEDETAAAGLALVTTEIGARWMDHDGDGAWDLVSRTPQGDRLFHNTGRGWFEESALNALVRPSADAWTPSLLPADPVEPAIRAAGEDEDASVNRDQPSSPRAHRGAGIPYAQTRATDLMPATAAAAPAATLPAIAVRCADAVLDQASGMACMQASSVPTLDMLYPISEQLYVSPGGEVGIGTTSPPAPLTVDGYANAITGWGRNLQLEAFAPNVLFHEQQSGNYYRIGLPNDSQDLRFERFGPGDTTAVTDLVVRAGHVGIGSSNPPAPLTVDGYANAITGWGRNLQLEAFAPNVLFHEQQSGNYYRIGLSNDTQNLHFQRFGPGATTAVTDMVIRNGDVGIGTSAPSTKLDVAGTAKAHCVTITGGCDIVEGFDTGSELCEPGAVVVIDGTRPGELRSSTEPYDKRVAGVVSGANGIMPGIRLAQEHVLDGSTPVAMAGRVYVKCSTENGAIEPGDLLTTSSTRGHAMRAAGDDRANGAVIGKAMSRLADGAGMVLVLVNLQ